MTTSSLAQPGGSYGPTLPAGAGPDLPYSSPTGDGAEEMDTTAPVSCPPVAAGPLSDTAAAEVALRLKVLGYPVRVKLMSLLFGSPAGEECGRVLSAAVGLPETTVSRHLQQLRLAGLIESQRRGMHVFHRPHRIALDALCTAIDPKAAGRHADSSASVDSRNESPDKLVGAVQIRSLVSLEGGAARPRRNMPAPGSETGRRPVRRASGPRFRTA